MVYSWSGWLVFLGSLVSLASLGSFGLGEVVKCCICKNELDLQSITFTTIEMLLKINMINHLVVLDDAK